MLLCFFVTWILSVNSISLNLKINNNKNGNGFYSIIINNETWLESGQMEGYMNNKFYSTNTTKASMTGWNLIKLLSTSETYNHFDDFGGSYNMITYEWMAEPDIIFETKFKTYLDGNAISFIQSYPNGVTGTNLIDASNVTSGCNHDTEAPFFSFPSFNGANMNNLYAKNELGYLTWTDQQISNSINRLPISSSHFAGINGGVMVLYKNRTTTDIENNIAVVVSPINHFSSFAQMNNLPSAIPVINMYNQDLNDHTICIGNDCKMDMTKRGYNIVNELDGIAMSAKITALSELDQVIPIHSWYSELRKDSYLSTKLIPQASSYKMEKDTVGYIYKYNDKDSTRLPLIMYYNDQKKDYTLAASNEMKDILTRKDYIPLSIEGYIRDKSYVADTNNDWRMGSNAALLGVPEGYQHEIAIVIGNGINDAMLNEWSKRVQSLYHTSKLSSKYDLATSHLGYWTDHGAYYYGDSYGQLNVMNLSCCSLANLKEAKDKLDEQGVPVKYMQLDDWWYEGRSPSQVDKNNWGGVKGVSHWQPPSAYFPGQLAGLSKAIQIPLLLYGPYFDPQNDWSGQFAFTPIDAGYVLPIPEQSYEFYSALFDFGINATTVSNDGNTGMIAYEIDFMDCLHHTPLFQLYPDKEEEWLAGIDKAARERGIVVQYCMTVSMNVMMALSFPQTTNARGSHDYASTPNFNIGPTALLTQAVGMKVSKDNFWTTIDEPIPPNYKLSGNDYNSTETHCLAALLSGGPVGISDGANFTNKTLIMRTCREDGRLLQTSRATTAIDDEMVYKAFYNSQFNIWASPFGPKNKDNLWNIVYAIDVQNAYNLMTDSLYPRLPSNFEYIVRNWHNYTNCKNNSMAVANGCIMITNKQKNGFLYTLKPQPVIEPSLHSLELITVTLASFDKLVFIGELNKYVSASQHRFDNLMIEGMTLSVDIEGAPSEIVQVTILKPNSNHNDYTVMTYNVTLDKDTGSSQFIISL